MNILDLDDDRLANWDELGLLYAVQSQDQHKIMVKIPEGIDLIYPSDLTKPMAETIQLVYATKGVRHHRDQDSQSG